MSRLMISSVRLFSIDWRRSARARWRSSWWLQRLLFWKEESTKFRSKSRKILDQIRHNCCYISKQIQSFSCTLLNKSVNLLFRFALVFCFLMTSVSLHLPQDTHCCTYIPHMAPTHWYSRPGPSKSLHSIHCCSRARTSAFASHPF